MKTISDARIHASLARALGMPVDRVKTAFRLATADDIPQILELRRAIRNAPITWDDETYWRWKYLGQPNLDRGEIPCWVFEKTNAIIAAMGFERIQLCADGNIHPAVWSYDIMVHPDYDGLGLGVLMNQVFQSHFPLLLVLGTNERSTRMLERLFTPLPPLRFWKKLVRTQPTLERYLKSQVLAPAIATVLDPLLATAEYCSRIRVPPRIQIRALEAFDTPVNLLCDRIQKQNRVLVRRHKEYLNWRFVNNPLHTYKCYGAFIGDRLHGYIVTHLTAIQRQKIGVIIDWLCDEDAVSNGSSLMRLLLQHSIAELARAGAHVVHAFAYQPSVEAILGSLWFIRDPKGDIPLFLGASPTHLEGHLRTIDNWILTKGDSDIG